jgi:hypothetical protein
MGKQPEKISQRGGTMTQYEESRGESEGRVTAAIERQTSQIPSITYLGLAIGSMALSASLKLMGRDNWALFVGQWPAFFLILGSYNKMVKQHGSSARSVA